MNANIWKKNAVLATVILFVCVAVYLNWSYGRGIASETEVGTDPQIEAGLPEHNPLEGSSVLGDGDPIVSLDTESASNLSGSDFFAQMRLNRQQARDGSLEILRESSEITDASQEARDAAILAINAIAANALKEAQIESLVMAKGFKDCMAYISDDGVVVVVAAPDGKLLSEQVSQIKDIVVSETGVSTLDIKITEAKG